MVAAARTPFGVLLKRYRVAAGLSQEALAERARLSTRGISDLERGRHRLPYRDTVARLAEALELNVTEGRRMLALVRQAAAQGIMPANVRTLLAAGGAAVATRHP
jgi:transcriptional regulator with XRE-family HTH domain